MLVALRGVRSVRTDAVGRFRLAVPATGEYVLSLIAGSALPSWRIRVGGQSAQFGTTLRVHLRTETETVVDFVSPGDLRAPTVEAVTSPPPNPAGWHTGPVQVRLRARDEQDGSGVEGLWYRLDPASEDETVYVDGTEASVEVAGEGVRELAYAAWDREQNEAPARLTVRIDSTAPSATVTTPADGAVYAAGAEVIADYACADSAPPGSGVQSCTGTVAGGTPLDTTTPGHFAFTVSARDVAGHETTRTATYTIAARPADFPPPPPAGGASEPSPDRTPPRGRLRAAAVQRLAAARRAGIAAACSSSERARCSIVGEVGARDARRLGIRVPRRARWVAIARASASVTPARPATVRVRLTRAARRALMRPRRIRVRLTATLVDAAGNRAALTRTVHLR
jgi:hypothetical protein